MKPVGEVSDTEHTESYQDESSGDFEGEPLLSEDGEGRRKFLKQALLAGGGAAAAKARRATAARFNRADEIILCRAEDTGSQLSLNKETAAVVMTHNYLADLELLRILLPSPVDYLGILGPKRRTVSLLSQLEESGIDFSEQELGRMHAPIGLGI